MLYGPDDKPIPRPTSPLEDWYNKRTLEILQKKFQFKDWWGPRLYDARGNQIESPRRGQRMQK